MQRFFVKPETIKEDRFLISDSRLVHQIARVLRRRVGDKIILLDNLGTEFLCKIQEIKKHEVNGTVLKQERKKEKISRQVILYQSLLKKDNFELVLQKCTELGIFAIQPIITDRTIKMKTKITERWRNIGREAAEQSDRIFIPEIYEPKSFKQAVQEAASKTDQKNFIAYEELAHTNKMCDRTFYWYQDNAQKIGIFIGPEGGFTKEEIELAKDSGIEPISLGPLILRAETAAISTLTLALLTGDRD